MKRIYILLTMVTVALAAIAARYEYTFSNTPIARALTTLVKEHPEAKITFIYNELDDYTTSAHVSTDDLKAAVKAITARNPISVSERKGHILVEALQKGKYRYSGKLVNEFGDPVPHATVLLLNPKDSVVLTYGMTGKDGSFLIPCDRNPVLAKISSTGYETRILNVSGTSMGSIRFNTRSVELENVDVVSDLMRLEPDRTVYVPLQRQKNTAINGIDLLEQMGIPQLHITTEGTLETLSGKAVSLFIDFLPATKDELSAMNLHDVKRVEYLESPADSRFMGEKFVVNLIMDKYIYGGYVKLIGYECLNINDQEGYATGRFQYRNMTYDLMSYTGNPNLTPSPHMSADLSYIWIPSKKGSINVFGSLWKVFDRYVYEYMPDGDRMIRYIRQPMGEYHLIRYGVSGRLYLFGRTLSLNGSVAANTARNGKPYGYTHTNVECRLSATYWLNDFYFSGSFSNPVTYSDGFMVGDLYESKSYYYLMAGWAYRNWNVRFRASNFGRWNWEDHRQRFTSEYYDRSFVAFNKNRHADFNITVTYTFNYGKKLRDESELSTSNSSSSGILRH